MNSIQSMAIVLTLFFSLHAHSAEICNEENSATLAKELIATLGKSLDSPHNLLASLITSAPCKVKLKLKNEEILEAIHAKYPSTGVQESSHGVQFLNEDPNLIKLWDHLMTDAKGTSLKAKVDSKCHEVICAVQHEFGKREGLLILNLLATYDINTSHHSFPATSKWSDTELELVTQAAADYPSGMFEFITPLRMVHYERDHVPEKYKDMNKENLCVPASSIEGNTEFYDCWAKKDALIRQMDVFHELAHDISSHLANLDVSDEWYRIAGWKSYWEKDSHGVKTLKSVSTKPACIVTPYGKANEHEDFAESVLIYRYNPQVLKSACPEKYAYLKKSVFSDIEYDEDKGCQQKSVKRD